MIYFLLSGEFNFITNFWRGRISIYFLYRWRLTINLFESKVKFVVCWENTVFTIFSNTSTYFFKLRRKCKTCRVLITPRAISLLSAFFSCDSVTKRAIEAARGNRQARGGRDHVAEKYHRLPVNLGFLLFFA